MIVSKLIQDLQNLIEKNPAVANWEISSNEDVEISGFSESWMLKEHLLIDEHN